MMEISLKSQLVETIFRTNQAKYIHMQKVYLGLVLTDPDTELILFSA